MNVNSSSDPNSSKPELASYSFAGCIHSRHERRVQVVMIIPQLRLAPSGDPSRQIDEVYGHGIPQNDRPVVALRNRLQDLRPSPAQFVPEQESGELDRLFYTDASVREGADLPSEQCARRRIVEVHTVWIREHELDAAERVSLSGVLAQAVVEVVGVYRRPVDGRRIDLFPARAEEADILCLQRAGIALQDRQLLLDGDTSWHVPVRIDLDVADFVAEYRGDRLRIADDDAHAEDIAAALGDVQGEVGEVDEHVRVAEIVG